MICTVHVILFSGMYAVSGCGQDTVDDINPRAKLRELWYSPHYG